jgi:large subunit ribosomal protein L3
MEYIKAKKIKMSQIFKDDKVIPVTLIEVLENPTELSLKVGDILTVSGISKGRGFQGGMKRHGFHGGSATHGQKNRQRAPGSIGSTATQRVIPGKRMAGRMGNTQVTLKKVKIIEAGENNKFFIKGAIPGRKGGLLKVRL